MKQLSESQTAAANSSGPQLQPLQARSSNSGTSIKRSDISQSSAIDISSEKAFFWPKSTGPNHLATHGQLTSAFAKKQDSS